MRRRALLQLGLASSLVLAVAGLGSTLIAPAWQGGRLSGPARALMAAVARAVLQGVLPADAPAQAAALQAHLGRVEDTISGFPLPVQQELALLLRLLATAPGRLGLAGLTADWEEASESDIQAMLQRLRQSSLDLRQQTYQALRDITYAAYFADRSSWASLGYAGPIAV